MKYIVLQVFPVNFTLTWETVLNIFNTVPSRSADQDLVLQCNNTAKTYMNTHFYTNRL